MDTWTITAMNPDDTGEAAGACWIVDVLHGTRGEALARGCEAIVDGWIDVRVAGTFSTYTLVGA